MVQITSRFAELPTEITCCCLLQYFPFYFWWNSQITYTSLDTEIFSLKKTKNKKQRLFSPLNRGDFHGYCEKLETGNNFKRPVFIQDPLLSFLQSHWTLQSLSATQGTTFLDLSGMGQFSPTLEKNSDTVILGNNLKKGAKESAVFLSPDYWRQPEDPLSENAPPRATATDRQNLETAEIPWPRCHQWQCQQMEPRITAGPGFLLIINTVLRVVTALSPPVWQTPLLSPQGVLWSSTLIKTLSQILLLFSWKSIQEGSCTKAARQMTASKKKKQT